MSPSVSIVDIAREAGVSHSTVSRALNDSPLVNEATRERIQTLACEMGYIPNAVARSLKAQRSGTIGLVVTSLVDPFFARVMAGVDEVAGEAGLSMFVTASHNDPDREMAVIETFHRRRVEGIIVAASRLTRRYRERLARIRVPLVLINQHTDQSQPGVYGVAFDERAGARMAVEHLLSLGHRRIGYLGLGNRQRSNRLRLAGYRETLEAAAIDPEPAWVHIVPEADMETLSDTEAGKIYLSATLDRGVTGLLCYNDRVAIGALLACRREGIAVPKDLSMVGFDDIEASRWVSPPLTTVRQPKRRMGRLAMQIMLDLLADRPVQDHLMPPELVRRDSSGSPPQ